MKPDEIVTDEIRNVMIDSYLTAPLSSDRSGERRLVRID